MPESSEVTVRVKLGKVELDYQGSESFLIEQIPELLETMAGLYHLEVALTRDDDPSLEDEEDALKGLQMTTSSIAAKLNVSSGGDLIMAAAARLTLVLKKGTFTRESILAEMKSASAYYKKSYSKNLTSYLTTQIKDGKLVESATSTYALSAGARKDLEVRLAP